MIDKRKPVLKKAKVIVPGGKRKPAHAAVGKSKPKARKSGPYAAPHARAAGRPSSPRSSAAKPAQKLARLMPKRDPLLHRPAPRPAPDLGIGAVEISPPKGAPRTIGIMAAEAAMDKKAFDVVVLDVRGISGLCDEMVIASARSVTHLGAVCDGVEEALRKQGERVVHSDGRHSAEPDWILLDYGDLMVQLFRPETRDHTRLEDYYASARLVAKWKND